MDGPMDGLGFPRRFGRGQRPEPVGEPTVVALEKLLPGGIRAGDTFYMNAVRCGDWMPTPGCQFSTVHDVNRLAEITLAEQ